MRKEASGNAGSTDSRTPLSSCYVMDRFYQPAFALLGWLLIVYFCFCLFFILLRFQ